MEVLIVEDDPISRKLLARTLAKLDYQVIDTKNGIDAWDILQQKPVQLVITDWLMPKMDGLELTRAIREAELPNYVYIMILTSQEGIDNVIDGLDAGADDYLVKPFNPRELSARLKIGERVLDLEQRLRGAHDKMKYLAMHDELTGLWNRRAFYSHALAELDHAARGDLSLCIIMLDIDHFKSVNDRFGHLVGDQALKMVADTLMKHVRQYDRVGRWGGEEFIVILPTTTLEESIDVAERLRVKVASAKLPLKEPEGDGALQVQISLGVACTIGDEGIELDTLVDRADEMLYQAKEAGRNRVCVYSETTGE
ncbi:MAG: diguanylate cyclase [Anaerolineales bacterium]|nr:diguanylate cyclase [Anaerolineales bacterium]